MVRICFKFICEGFRGTTDLARIVWYKIRSEMPLWMKESSFFYWLDFLIIFFSTATMTLA